MPHPIRLEWNRFLKTRCLPSTCEFTRLPWWLRQWSVCLQCRRPGFNPWVGKIPWRRKWQPTPVLLPGKFHGQRSLVGYSPWDGKESDTTERLHSLCVNSQATVGPQQLLQVQFIQQWEGWSYLLSLSPSVVSSGSVLGLGIKDQHQPQGTRSPRVPE